MSGTGSTRFDLVLLEVPVHDVRYLEHRVVADEHRERVATMSTHMQIVQQCQVLVSSLLHFSRKRPSNSDLAAPTVSQCAFWISLAAEGAVRVEPSLAVVIHLVLENTSLPT